MTNIETHRDKTDPSELANPEITTTVPVVRRGKPGRALSGWSPFIVFAALAGALLIGIFTLPSRELQAGSAVILMITLMFLKVPVALSLAVPGLVGIFAISGPRALETVAGGLPYAAVASWSLSVLPMFILMGMLLWSSGLTSKLYQAARDWIGFLPGGLAIGTNVAGTGLAAVSGSTIGTTFALARVGIPEMLRAGYDKKLAIGSVVVAGLPGQLIPPSTFLVIVAGLLSVPVGPQLMAGVVPGITVSVLFSVAFLAFSLIKPKWVGRGVKGAVQDHATWSDRWKSIPWLIPILVIMFVVFGGMFSGIFTATEAGAVGAFAAIIVCVVMQRKNRPFDQVVKGIVASVGSVGAIFLMLIGAHILGQLLAISGLGRLFSGFVVDMGLGRIGFLLLVMVIYIILGMFMDPLAILLLTLPVFIPVLQELDVSLLWFGVFAVFMGELAILTPPVGVLSFIIHSIVQDPAVNLGHKITLCDVFKSVGLVFPITIIFALLMIFVPELATWLPDQMK